MKQLLDFPIESEISASSLQKRILMGVIDSHFDLIAMTVVIFALSFMFVIDQTGLLSFGVDWRRVERDSSRELFQLAYRYKQNGCFHRRYDHDVEYGLGELESDDLIELACLILNECTFFSLYDFIGYVIVSGFFKL